MSAVDKPLYDAGPVCFGRGVDRNDQDAADCIGCRVRTECNDALDKFDESRADVIGQNGNTGEHYDTAPPKPSDAYRTRLLAAVEAYDRAMESADEAAQEISRVVVEVLVKLDGPHP